jgi:murein L,D-transpeptidase YcbB/YkuD
MRGILPNRAVASARQRKRKAKRRRGQADGNLWKMTAAGRLARAVGSVVMLACRPVVRRRWVALALVLALAAAEAPAVEITVFRQAVAEAAVEDAAIAAFYRARDYAPLWTGEDAAARRAALLSALAQAPAHGLPAVRYHPDAIAEAFRTARGEREIGRLEVAVTRAFLAFARDIQSGALEPAQVLPGEIRRELPRRDPGMLLAAFAAAPDPAAFLRALAPRSAAYAMLLREKARLERVIAAGGWGPRVPGERLEPGATGAAVVALRDRLAAMGFLPPTVTARYDATITAAVRAFQRAHGLPADGIAGAATLAEVNRPAEERLQAVLVALERERWMNLEGGLGARHIWVNLPDFTARIVDEGKVSFETRAVIGERRPDKRTVEFSDAMEYMEVNPDWTVPRSILARDYLPRMQANPNAASYLQLIDARGRVVPRSAVNFAAYSARNFPFSLRQPPGPSNSLGRVKFMFPNPYSIYLHDTPAKELFQREVRDYSSGCIRLADPFDFAYRLLERQMDNPRPYFDGLVDSGRQTRVRLETQVPVHLVYFTAYPDATGVMQYRRDIYGRDAALFRALIEAGVAFPGASG